MHLQCSYCGFFNNYPIPHAHVSTVLSVCAVCQEVLTDHNVVTVSQLLHSLALPRRCTTCNSSTNVLVNSTCTLCNARSDGTNFQVHQNAPPASTSAPAPTSASAPVVSTILSEARRIRALHQSFSPRTQPQSQSPPSWFNIWDTTSSPTVQWAPQGSTAPNFLNFTTTLLSASPPPVVPSSFLYGTHANENAAGSGDNTRNANADANGDAAAGEARDSGDTFRFNFIELLLSDQDVVMQAESFEEEDDEDEEDDIVLFPLRAGAGVQGHAAGGGSNGNGAVPLHTRARAELVITPSSVPPDFLCSVCLVGASESTTAQELLVLPCAHTFHAACINRWFTNHCTCPVCRDHLHRRWRARAQAQTQAQTEETFV